MKIAIVLLTFVLLIWFLGCVKAYRISEKVLIDGMESKSLEFKKELTNIVC